MTSPADTSLGRGLTGFYYQSSAAPDGWSPSGHGEGRAGIVHRVHHRLLLEGIIWLLLENPLLGRTWKVGKEE